MENKETIEQNNQEILSLEQCQHDLVQWKEKCIQITADFSNFKRRAEKDQLQWATLAQARLATAILPIVDNFERALHEKPEASDTKINAWIQGISMIHVDLQKMMEAFDIKEIPATGEFDPHYHEALTHEASNTHQSGTIVTVFEKGYMMGSTVLRVAKVSVAQ